ncbi:NAD(P)-binding protein [Rhizoclosmatium globosum]|uniref:NAD(P)-binding protein n=1 Tax=Rhizoclosmatium globosum TaxID=329046 RepID=A0A1Y2C3P9_9FUNG|nr:NAD(P)-binding protein [Rhizoclosmatium globosum]|eukprot:ORY40935.1 NAD(P)-binding protein [Rhizoclosmatium globosum]
MSVPVFVTGGSGFVGGRLIAHLLSKGIPVVALSRSPASDEVIRAIDPSAADSIRLVRGDLHADAAVLAEEMRGVATVYHLAAHADPRANLADLIKSNVDGTRNIVAAAKLAGVKRFVHCSTCAVYLRNEHSPVRSAAENSRLDPPTWAGYAYTKKLADDLVLEANQDGVFETVSLRPNHVWGIGDTQWLPGLIKAIKENQLKRFTPSGYFVSTTNIENLCDAFLLAAKNGRPGHAYNVIDSQDIQFEEFVERYVQTREPGLKFPSASIPFSFLYTLLWLLDWIPFVKKFLPINRELLCFVGQEYTINGSKAHNELEYKASMSREEGLLRMSQQ